MEDNEKQFIKGFNNGYLLAKYQPDLLAKVTKDIDSKNEYINGMFAGEKEHNNEKTKEHSNIKRAFPEKNKDRDKDKDFERGHD